MINIILVRHRNIKILPNRHHKCRRFQLYKPTKIMQRSYINRAMHDLHTLNKIFIPIFELVNETNKYEL